MFEEFKEEYNKIKHIECPAFNNEEVHFTNLGYTHIFKKGRKYRIAQDRDRRIMLFKHVPNIVHISQQHFEYRAERNIEFWSLIKVKKYDVITVVIQQIKGEPKKFLSVMNKKRKGPR